MTNNKKTIDRSPDIVLIGSGIMSATLGTLLKELEPDLTIDIYERMDTVASESTSVWNNAGTGHSAFCELNYTPELPDGSIDASKAINIASSFSESLQFWSYLIENNIIDKPEDFIQQVPHISFVWGEERVNFLRKRYKTLKNSALFNEMEYSEDHAELSQWMPLVMNGRTANENCAATRVKFGTDINFGALAIKLFEMLKQKPDVNLYLGHQVKKLKKTDDTKWNVEVEDIQSGEVISAITKFVFIGGGGASLQLLLKSGIPEGKKYGGFPVSGQWLRCVNEEVIENHQSKVYGKAASGTPPMSVPHLDTRIINGKRELLFGPYAGFTTKFLNSGSYFDLPSSIKTGNIGTLLSAGYKNIPLTKYLINQARLTPEERFEVLKEYVPNAKMEDWKLQKAGKRVQVIKKSLELGSVVEFGTEIVASEDGSIAALLGASPGASTATSIMLKLIDQCVKDKAKSRRWKDKLKSMIPTYELSLGNNPLLIEEVRNRTRTSLGLIK